MNLDAASQLIIDEIKGMLSKPKKHKFYDIKSYLNNKEQNNFVPTQIFLSVFSDTMLDFFENKSSLDTYDCRDTVYFITDMIVDHKLKATSSFFDILGYIIT